MKKEKDMDIFVNISHKKIHANYFKVEYMDELLNGRTIKELAEYLGIGYCGLLDCLLGFRAVTDQDSNKLIYLYAKEHGLTIKVDNQDVPLDEAYDIFVEKPGENAKFADFNKWVDMHNNQYDKYMIVDKEGLLDGKSVVEIAKELNMSRSYVSQMVNGNVCVMGETVAKLLVICDKEFDDKYEYFKRIEEN